MRVHIIGGGLAGSAMAYVLKSAGHGPIIYEASSELASGASGNNVGLYNPRVVAFYKGIGHFYSDAFFEALGVFSGFGDAIDWNACGALHVINTEKKEKRYLKAIKNWAWRDEDMRIVSALEASDLAGVPIQYDCLYLAKAGRVSPKKLCSKYAEGVDVRLNTPIDDLSIFGQDLVVVACGMACLKFPEAAHLPLNAVRGQVSYIRETARSKSLKATISYGGYMAPAVNGVHCIGSTFQPWMDDPTADDDDDKINLEKLSDHLPSLVDDYEVLGHRAGVRTASKDHIPIVGRLNDSVFISTAHGSHGVLSTVISAKILLDIVINNDKSMPYDKYDGAVCPRRFE